MNNRKEEMLEFLDRVSFGKGAYSKVLKLRNILKNNVIRRLAPCDSHKASLKVLYLHMSGRGTGIIIEDVAICDCDIDVVTPKYAYIYVHYKEGLVYRIKQDSMKISIID